MLFSRSLPSSSLFLFPSPCSPICRSSTVFLLPLLPNCCLLLFAPLSVSISLTPVPPGVFCSLLILSDFTRQTLYKRWVLFWTWSRTASFHTLQTPLSLPQEFQAAFRERLPGASKSPHIAKKKNQRKDHRDMLRSVEGSYKEQEKSPSFSLLGFALLLPPPRGRLK